MGKVILCSGERAKEPYAFSETGVKVYSMEELCYYIYNYIFYVNEDMFIDDLFDWIDNELKLSERAERLRQMKIKNEDLKSMITVVLCSADYYTELEIKKLLPIIDEIADMTPIKKNCYRASNYLKEKNFVEAVAEFEKIFNSEEAKGLSPKEYGNLLHNLAVAKAHVTGLLEAMSIFKEAFERNQEPESLKQYLYALRLTNNNELFEAEVAAYQVSQEMYDNVISDLDLLNAEVKESALMQEITTLKVKLAKGKVNEYYQLIDEMIGTWKQQYRRGN